MVKNLLFTLSQFNISVEEKHRLSNLDLQRNKLIIQFILMLISLIEPDPS